MVNRYKKYLTEMLKNVSKYRMTRRINIKLKQKQSKYKFSITKDYENKIHEFWNEYIPISSLSHQWYSSVNNNEDVRYIPEDVFYNRIVPFFNNQKLAKAFSDKNYYNVFFDNVKLPEVIAKNINGVSMTDDFEYLSYEDMVSECLKQEKIVIKPSIDSGGGKGIVFLEMDGTQLMEKKLRDKLRKRDNNYIIQKFVEQHEVINSLNSSSLNTIRLMTFLDKNGVHVLSSHIRIGINNSQSDHFGFVCGISEDGTISNYGVSSPNGERLDSHPNGNLFKGVEIPNYELVKKLAIDNHRKLSHFRLVAWDISINSHGNPILIEVNLRTPGINNHQLTIGPLFGELTETVLDEVFRD